MTAILLVLLLCGGGGFAATLGVQWAIGTVTGLIDPAGASDHAGDPRLVKEVTSSAGVLTVTVTGVRTTGQFTLIDLVAANSGSETLIMPVFGRTQLAVPGAATLEGDPFRSKWAGSVPAGGELRGTIVFGGTLGAQVTTVSLSFTVIHGGPGSLTVKDIPLQPAG